MLVDAEDDEDEWRVSVALEKRSGCQSRFNQVEKLSEPASLRPSSTVEWRIRGGGSPHISGLGHVHRPNHLAAHEQAFGLASDARICTHEGRCVLAHISVNLYIVLHLCLCILPRCPHPHKPKIHHCLGNVDAAVPLDLGAAVGARVVLGAEASGEALPTVGTHQEAAAWPEDHVARSDHADDT